MLEYKILNAFVCYMEATGSTYNVVSFTLDQDWVDEINKPDKSIYTLEEIEKAANICITQGWIKRNGYDNKYNNLQITLKGVGVARSRSKADELKSSRSVIKKVSDSIVDHSGVFIALGIIIAMATFALAIFED